MAAIVPFPPRPSRLRAVLLAVLRAPDAIVRRRRLLGELGGFDERMLRDIGLSRHDVASAAAEPLFRDPSLMLARRAADRREAWRANARERLAFGNLVRLGIVRDRAAWQPDTTRVARNLDRRGAFPHDIGSCDRALT